MTTRDRWGPEIAFPLPTTPPKAGGRWLALGGWPIWRRKVSENGAADAANLMGPMGR